MDVGRSAVLCIVTAVAAVACDDEPKKDTPTAAAPSAEPKPAATTGLEAAANDPKVVELAKKARECKWSSEGYDLGCKAVGRFVDGPEIQDGKADETLVNFLEDPESQVRWLGAMALRKNGSTYAVDLTLAERVVDVAREERDVLVAAELGAPLAKIDGKKTGQDLAEVIRRHPVEGLRSGAVAVVLEKNPELKSLVEDLAKKDSSEEVRERAAAVLRDHEEEP